MSPSLRRLKVCVEELPIQDYPSKYDVSHEAIPCIKWLHHPLCRDLKKSLQAFGQQGAQWDNASCAPFE